MIRFRLLHTLAACAAGTIAAAAPVWAQSYTFTNVTDINQEFQGLFSPPQLNAGGTLLFHARLDNGHNGIFTKAVGGPTTTITSTASGTSGGGSLAAINASGTVSFHGLNSSGSPSQGIYTGSGGALAFIAGNETGSPFSSFGSSGVQAINDAGTVVFYAQRRASAGGGEGIFTRSGDGTGPITTVADSTSGTFNGFPATQYAINASGSIAFRADSTNPAAQAGIFVVAPGGGVITVADFSDGITFPATTSINNSGTVVFSAQFGGLSSIFTGNGGALTTIATTAGAYQQFRLTPTINNNGMVAFGAILDDFRAGIFTGPDPVADKVIISGDMLFGATVSDVQFFRGLNDNGDIAFQYSLNNGMSGVAVASIASTDLPGDYNDDGVVNAADYVVWRDHLGAVASLPNDSTPGVDASDYVVWKGNFGATPPQGAGAGTTIPEPSAMMLIVCAMAIAFAGFNSTRCCKARVATVRMD